MDFDLFNCHLWGSYFGGLLFCTFGRIYRSIRHKINFVDWTYKGTTWSLSLSVIRSLLSPAAANVVRRELQQSNQTKQNHRVGRLKDIRCSQTLCCCLGIAIGPEILTLSAWRSNQHTCNLIYAAQGLAHKLSLWAISHWGEGEPQSCETPEGKLSWAISHWGEGDPWGRSRVGSTPLVRKETVGSTTWQGLLVWPQLTDTRSIQFSSLALLRIKTVYTRSRFRECKRWHHCSVQCGMLSSFGSHHYFDCVVRMSHISNK